MAYAEPLHRDRAGTDVNTHPYARLWVSTAVVSTDRRKPTINANGELYGALEVSADYLPVLNPVSNDTSRVPLTVRDPATEPADVELFFRSRHN